MNPSGIIFGSDASLNISGSFVATTANAIQFGDRGFFSATNPTPPSPLLTINPSAFVFNQLNQGRILSQSVAPADVSPSGRQLFGLQVPDGQSLLLVGGDVQVDGGGRNGGLNAQGGRVELGGLASSGSIALIWRGDQPGLNFPVGVPRANVSLTNNARISVRGVSGGDILVHAEQFTAKDAGRLVAGTEGAGAAGDITINASRVDLTGENSGFANHVLPTATGNSGNIFINTNVLSLDKEAVIDSNTFGRGNAGNIVINTGSLLQTNGAALRSVIFGNGDSGNIVINARESILFDASNIVMGTLPGGNGNGGTVQITTGSLSLINGAHFDLSSAGQGNGGTVVIQAAGAVNLSSKEYDSGLIFTGITQNAQGTAGDILITAASLSLRNGLLNASVIGLNADGSGVSGRGGARNIILNIGGAVVIEGLGDKPSGLVSSLGLAAEGKAGNITLNAGTLDLNQAVINNAAFGIGNAGDITIQVAAGIRLNESNIDNSVLTPPGFATAVGNSGEIRIQTSTLTATNSAITSQTSGQGNAGNQFITVDTLQLNNSLIGASPTNGGNAGSIQIDARDAVVLQGNEAFIGTALLSGTGRGGDITINTGTLSLMDTENAGINSITDGRGDAGTITLNARDRILINNSSVVSAVASKAQGSGGDIRIRAGSVALVNGGNLNAVTEGQGNAGNITIDAKDAISIVGISPNRSRYSGIFNNVATTGQGNGGNTQISTGALTIGNDAGVSASTFGNGNAGNIDITAKGAISISNANATTAQDSGIYVLSRTNGSTGNIIITAPRLTISDRGVINASSNSVNGGNITLNLKDYLLLRRGGSISTNAGTAQQGGNGGDITINAPNGFIIAVLKENSDISANAFTGNGGNVDITAQGIYGLRFQPRLTPFSDITASSTFGVSGVVAINTLGLDPSGGLVQLPTGLVDPSNKVDQRCAPKGAGRASTFTATGTGGIATSPTDPLMSQGAVMELVELPEGGNGLRADEPDKWTAPSVTSAAPSVALSDAPIVEAQGWIVDRDGTVHLVADARVGIPQNPTLMPPDCSIQPSLPASRSSR
jgi:large exoprotein involved in heme utilization and adhesion